MWRLETMCIWIDFYFIRNCYKVSNLNNLFFHLLQPFNETVRVCHNPLVRTCNNDTEGEPICNTYYETVCETSYKSYEVEQDEPICKMELMKKCDNVTSKFSFFIHCGKITKKEDCHDILWVSPLMMRNSVSNFELTTVLFRKL